MRPSSHSQSSCSSRIASLGRMVNITCGCGKLAKNGISKSTRRRARYYGCQDWPHGCSFFTWEEDLIGNSVDYINESNNETILLNKIVKLKAKREKDGFELDALRRENGRLKTIIVVLMLCCCIAFCCWLM